MSLFTLVCYPESCNIEQSLQELCFKHNVRDYAYILHNKDKDKDGNLKKEHYHVVIMLEFKDPNHSKPEQQEISKLFGLIGGQCGQCARSEKNTLLYLVHANDKDKYQYETQEIVYYADMLSTIFSRALNEREKNENNTFENVLEEVLVYIENYKDMLSWFNVLQYLRKKKILTKCVAYMGILKDYVREHNVRISLDAINRERTLDLLQKYEDLEEIKKGNYITYTSINENGEIVEKYEILA